MHRAVWLTLCACNQVFDLRTTGLVDAPPYIEPTPDAPFACPDTGPPRFTGIQIVWSTRPCYGYTTSLAGGALAECFDSGRFEVGAVEGPLSPAPGLPTRTSFVLPRLYPEGDTLLLHSKGMPREIRTYTFASDTWTQSGALPSVSGLLEASTPSQAPDRRVLLHAGATTYEYAETATGWMNLQRSYTRDELTPGLTSAEVFSLSPDGLQLVFYGKTDATYGAYYTRRPSLADRFPPAQLLEGVPAPPYGDPFIAADCSRIYFSGDNAMFMISQQL